MAHKAGLDRRYTPSQLSRRRCLDRLEVNFVDIDVAELRARLRLQAARRRGSFRPLTGYPGRQDIELCC